LHSFKRAGPLTKQSDRRKMKPVCATRYPLSDLLLVLLIHPKELLRIAFFLGSWCVPQREWLWSGVKLHEEALTGLPDKRAYLPSSRVIGDNLSVTSARFARM
jgi:hypothetical protein